MDKIVIHSRKVNGDTIYISHQGDLMYLDKKDGKWVLVGPNGYERCRDQYRNDLAERFDLDLDY